MAQSLNMGSIMRSSGSLFTQIAKYHYIISISLIVGGVAFTTYYINDILNNPPSSNDSMQEVGFSDTFDTETIKKINQFKYSDESSIKPLPGGRINPFGE